MMIDLAIGDRDWLRWEDGVLIGSRFALAAIRSLADTYANEPLTEAGLGIVSTGDHLTTPAGLTALARLLPERVRITRQEGIDPMPANDGVIY